VLFNVHPPSFRIVKRTGQAMAAGEKPIDWGIWRALAVRHFAADLGRASAIRVGAGTGGAVPFSHRHRVLFAYGDRVRSTRRRSRLSREQSKVC